MPEYKLSRKEIFGGRLIDPMRKWLRKQGIETKGYSYNDDMAIITHYLQNKDIEAYREKALNKMKDYYRALHSLDADTPVTNEEAESIFEGWDDSKLCQKYKDNRSFTFVDLFAGIGGFRIALEQLGGRCLYASEFNTAAQESYGHNHGVIPFGDITKDENKALVPENVDVLCAGFPCQPFSLAGLRRGFTDQTKGTLFFDLAKIIHDKHPRIILLENVPGLMSIYNKDELGNRTDVKTIHTILDILRNELGYHVPKPEILNACHFGVPQNRDRVFIVGFRDAEEFHYRYPTGDGIDDVYFGEIREKRVVESGYYMSERYWQTLLAHKEAQRAKGRGYGYCRVKDDEFGHTLMVGGMGLERNLVEDPGNPLENVQDPRGELNHDHIRVLTELECARMQGFPDEFEIVAKKHPAYDQFGNSVAVPVVREVAQSLLDHAGISHEIYHK